MEEILKADPGQLQAEDSVYGGTPLHWAKTAEVIMCFVVRIVVWLYRKENVEASVEQ